jgi:hypothetical protein
LYITATANLKTNEKYDECRKGLEVKHFSSQIEFSIDDKVFISQRPSLNRWRFWT